MRAADREEEGEGEAHYQLVYRGELRVIALLLSHRWNFTSDFSDAINVE